MEDPDADACTDLESDVETSTSHLFSSLDDENHGLLTRSDDREKDQHQIGLGDDGSIQQEVYEEQSFAKRKKNEKKNKKKERPLGLLGMVMIVFFTVGGGPLGSEEIISSGGPVLGMIIMFIFPFVYCFPVSLIFAELATEFPEDASFTIWVESTFGRFCAFQDGYFSWISGVLDSAMYPVLGAEMILGSQENSFRGNILIISLAVLGSIFNFLGVRIVGDAMTFLGVIVMLPYFIMVLISIFYFGTNHYVADDHPTQAPSKPEEKIDKQKQWSLDWIDLLHSVFWSYSGWDSVATFAGEIENPRRNFPVGLLISVSAVSLSYIIPFMCALFHPASPHWTTWKEGSFREIAKAIGGPLLELLVSISSVVTLFAMYSAEMFIDSFLLVGMAEQRLIPSFLGARSKRFDSPWVALIVSLLIICSLARLLGFVGLMLVNNSLTCLSVLIELISALVLRFRTQRSVHAHEFRAPIGNVAMLIMLIPSILIAVFILISTIFLAKAIVRLVLLAFLGAGVVLFAGFSRKAGKCD